MRFILRFSGEINKINRSILLPHYENNLTQVADRYLVTKGAPSSHAISIFQGFRVSYQDPMVNSVLVRVNLEVGQ